MLPSEEILLKDFARADQLQCTELEQSIRGTLQKYKQHFQYIAEMEPIGAMLSRCQEQIQIQQNSATQQQNSSAMEMLREIYALISTADTLVEQINGKLQTKIYTNTHGLIESYQQVQQQKQEIIAKTGDIERMPVVAESFRLLEAAIQTLIERIVENVVKTLELMSKQNFISSFPPNFDHLREILQLVDENAGSLKVIKVQNPQKYQTVKVSIISSVMQYFNGSSTRLLNDLQPAGTTPDPARFVDLQLVQFHVQGYQELQDYLKNSFVQVKLKHLTTPGDQLLFQYFGFVLQFLFICEENVGKVFDATPSGREPQKGVFQNVQQVLHAIVQFCFIGEEALSVKTIEQMIDLNPLCCIFSQAAIEHWRRFASLFAQHYPNASAIFLQITDQFHKKYLEVLAKLSQTLQAQVQQLKPGIYQAGILQLSMSTVVVPTSLILMQAQADYDCHCGFAKYQAQTESLKLDVRNRLMRELNQQLKAPNLTADQQKQIRDAKEALNSFVNQAMEVDSDPIVFFAKYEFRPQFLEVVQSLVKAAELQLEAAIRDNKDEVREKYGDLARLVHFHLLATYYGNFFKEFMPELETQLQQSMRSNLDKYMMQQLVYKIPWIQFMEEIDKLLAQNFTLQDVPAKPGLGPKQLTKVVQEMPKYGGKSYLDLCLRIEKQLGHNDAPIAGLSPTFLGDSIKQLKQAMHQALVRLVADKYRRFLNIIEKSYGLNLQMVSQTELLQSVQIGMADFQK